MNEMGSKHPPKPITPPPQDPDDLPHRILVVEDDADIRRINANVLIRSGYQVDAAEDGAAAWLALQLRSYDLLVTDNDMPKVSGVELLKKLRAARMSVPVIMATGTVPKDEFIRQPWLNPAATLRKPYTIDELLVTVRQVLHAAAPASETIARPLDWQNLSPSDGWQL